MRVLLSIKPEFADRIFSGIKRYEFRKTIYANRTVRSVVVYATRPIRRIVGEFEVDAIHAATPEQLWALTQAHAGITREGFDAYFKGRSRAFAIRIGAVKKYDAPLVPEHVIDNFVAPQSFMYLSYEHSRVSGSERQLELL